MSFPTDTITSAIDAKTLLLNRATEAGIQNPGLSPNDFLMFVVAQLLQSVPATVDATVTGDLTLSGSLVGDGEDYAGTSSFQVVGPDLNLGAAAGNTASNPKFLAPIMGNVLGASLTKEGAYIAGMIAALSVTGARATLWQVGAQLGVIMDGVTDADGCFVAVVDGSDPSAQTNARAAFAVAMNNNHASSGVQYGVDLKDAGRGATALTAGLPFKITKALVRSPTDVCLLEGDGAPSSGASGTGDNFAGPGSQYIDYTNGNLYIQVGAITSPSWKLVTRAA